MVPGSAPGSQVLASVAEVRVEDGLVCGVDGWPATGCADQVPGVAPGGTEQPVTLALPGQPTAGGNSGTTSTDAVAPAANPDEGTDGVQSGLVIGLAVLALLGVLVLLRSRRSTSS